ncbi:MAG: hypothetical protein HGA86_06680 [Anaerolineaceae bacterium]|nr:hypothetical protein [Anaerolineaceae bacterium]
MYAAYLDNTTILLTVFGALVISLAFGYGCSQLTTRKGRGGREGFALGFFLWIGGLIICAFLPDLTRIPALVPLGGRPIPLIAFAAADDALPPGMPSWTGDPKQKTCPKCKRSSPVDAKFCFVCGTAFGSGKTAPLIPPVEAPCPACGRMTPDAEPFCMHCGVLKANHQPVQPDQSTCPGCGAALASKEIPCAYCGFNPRRLNAR